MRTIDQYNQAGMAKKKRMKNNCRRQLHCFGWGERGRGVGPEDEAEDVDEEADSDVVGDGIVKCEKSLRKKTTTEQEMTTISVYRKLNGNMISILYFYKQHCAFWTPAALYSSSRGKAQNVCWLLLVATHCKQNQ